jgi:hypothetical protein
MIRPWRVPCKNVKEHIQNTRIYQTFFLEIVTLNLFMR